MTQKPDQRPTTTPKRGESGEQHDYVGARRVEDPYRSFATKNRRATPADHPEADDLDGVRRTTADRESHRSAQGSGDECDPHADDNLDKGLEETFPASDPVSISPGAD
jgi:hypothetical protein